MRPANLARLPFRNERLPNLLFAAAAVALVALTVRHAFLVRALLPRAHLGPPRRSHAPGGGSPRSARSRASLRGVAPDPKALARWLVVKELVDRRAFSWTTCSRARRAASGRGAPRLHRPTVQHGEILLDVQAVVRSPEVGWQFIARWRRAGTSTTCSR